MDKNKQILETLQMQPLSEEEKASRHILGRLYGPIATCEESTRNGRKYNRELWEKALNDELFNEKIKNKSLFLELGHPANREETDMEKVCACIPVMPKIVDGDLYAYVDILDTPNGRLLKTLCDYGFIPGISSRGSGDIMANDEVDPETFFLETWDIVQLPAVKKARLAMCESVDPEALKLKQALTESYIAASDKDRKEMKESLDRLNIELDEAVLNDVPYEEAEVRDDILVEDEEPEMIEDEIVIKEESGIEEVPAEDIAVKTEETVEESEVTEIPTEEAVAAVEDVAEEIKEVVEATEEQAEAIDEIVQEKVEEIEPPVEEPNEQAEVEETPVEDIEAESIEESGIEDAESTEKAEDSGLNEWIANLKEMIRQKDLLEAEIKTLKEQKAVSDAEVKGLKEELERYKTGFVRVSELASKASKFEKDVQSLSEQLTQKNSEINSLRAERTETTRLTESVNASEIKVKSLTEKLDAMQKDLTDTEAKLNEQKVQSKAKLTEAVAIAKSYKANYESVMSHYIESKASMLGVRITDITSRLNENYSCKDVDAVCEELLEAPQHFSNSLFSEIKNGASIKINESAAPKKANDGGYDIDDDLLELAGLK